MDGLTVSAGRSPPSIRACPCGTSLARAEPPCPFDIHPDALRAIAVPPGLTLIPGGDGSAHRPLAFAPPPPISLSSADSGEIIELLRYAGVTYAGPDSAAATMGLRVFAAGRALALDGPHDAVTFDWDHTFSNNQIFEGVLDVARVRRLSVPPGGAAPMVAIETPRPFMMELAFGMMAGFALRQGLSRLSEWERYRPQVGVATHTWPDRIGLTARYVAILPLMEGLLPGSPGLYEHFTSPAVRSVIHLHHFLDYTTELVRRFDAQGPSGLAPAERDELKNCLADGGAHRRKPIGAWAMQGWDPGRLLHVDDSPPLIADLARQAALAGHAGARFIHAPHSHSRLFPGVKAWHMLSLPSLWRGRPAAMRGVIAHLARLESARSAVPGLMRRLGHPLEDWPAAGLPAGTVMAIYPTPTDVGTFWDQYVGPVARARQLIRAVRSRHVEVF